MMFATTNIVLKGNAINGNTFHKKHAVTLLEIFTKLLKGKPNCSGLFIVEVGFIDDPCDSVGPGHRG